LEQEYLEKISKKKSWTNPGFFFNSLCFLIILLQS
jgi:hypothetical protein